MHFLYFAEQKLARFYDYLVERTEETTTKKVLREGSGQVDVKGKGTFGSILAYFGLASLEVEANVSASGKLSFSEEVVSKFTPPRKLKALLLKLTSEGRISNINDKEVNLLGVGAPVAFATWMQVDTVKRPVSMIEETGAVIFSGDEDNCKVEIQASLEFMESRNAWRRLQSKRFIAGFGTLIGVNAKEHLVEIDPIVLRYAEEYLSDLPLT
jgi:hypothetical protein